MTSYALRLHRWLALIFALPLAALIVTGFFLAFEPTVHLFHRAPGSLSAGQVLDILKTHDPGGAARAITYRNYEGTLEIHTAMQGRPILVDVESRAAKTAPGTLAAALGIARRIHVSLLYDLRPLVTTTTIALLALIGLGLAMGLPRVSGTLSGWHKMTAWIGLPLLIASPLTGALMAFNVTMGGGGAAPMTMGAPAAKLTMIDVVQAAGANRDLSNMVWIRTMWLRHMMRYMENGQFQGYFVTPKALVPVPRNWPRSIHEGLWIGSTGSVLNVVVSLMLAGLLTTGLLLWLRRQGRRGRRLQQDRSGLAAST